MNATEAAALHRLLRHLDGSEVQTYPADLLPGIRYLAARTPNSVPNLVVDEETLLDVLQSVAQRFADGCYWDDDDGELRLFDGEPGRPVEVAPVRGGLL